MLLDKKQRCEDNEAKRKSRVEEKDLKMKQLALEAGRKNEIRSKIRDLEKVLTFVRACDEYGRLYCIVLPSFNTVLLQFYPALYLYFHFLFLLFFLSSFLPTFFLFLFPRSSSFLSLFLSFFLYLFLCFFPLPFFSLSFFFLGSFTEFPISLLSCLHLFSYFHASYCIIFTHNFCYLICISQILKISRETLSKSIRKRKDDAKLRVEIICDREEAFKTLRSGPKDPIALLNLQNVNASTLDALVGTMRGMKKEVEGVENKVENSLEIRSADVTLATVPHTSASNQSKSSSQHQNQSDSGSQDISCLSVSLSQAPVLVRLEGDIFGQVLELWGFLCTFAQPLKALTIPSISHLCNSVRACEPNFKKLMMNSRGAKRSFESVSAR